MRIANIKMQIANCKLSQRDMHIRKSNERIIAESIDKHFGPGSYQKVKSSREAVQALLNYIVNHKSVAVVR